MWSSAAVAKQLKDQYVARSEMVLTSGYLKLLLLSYELKGVC